MKQSEVMSEYSKAVEFMKTMAAIYDAMAEYKIHKVIIRINGEDSSTTKIEDAWDARFFSIKVANLYYKSSQKTILEEITKPLNPGVLKLDFTR